MRAHGAFVGRRFRSVTKLTTKVRVGRGYLWGSFLIAAAALKTPTRNGYNAQGANLEFYVYMHMYIWVEIAHVDADVLPLKINLMGIYLRTCVGIYIYI